MTKRDNPLHWMPFSVDLWLGELAGGMRADQKGALMDLLSIAWQQQPPCTLPDDDAFLATRSGLGGKWKASRAVILSRFVPADDGRLLCGWLRDVYDEQHTKYTNRSNANRNNRRGTKGSTNRDTHRVQREEGALPFQGKEPLPAEPAPAPDGAAQLAGGSGNYLDSSSAREALLRRGVRAEQIDAAPTGSLVDLNAELEWRQVEYDRELAQSADGWMAINPTATKEIGGQVRASLGLPAEGAPSPLKREALRAGVVEAIRQRQGWPTVDTWDCMPLGVEPAEV